MGDTRGGSQILRDGKFLKNLILELSNASFYLVNNCLLSLEKVAIYRTFHFIQTLLFNTLNKNKASLKCLKSTRKKVNTQICFLSNFCPPFMSNQKTFSLFQSSVNACFVNVWKVPQWNCFWQGKWFFCMRKILSINAKPWNSWHTRLNWKFCNLIFKKSIFTLFKFYFWLRLKHHFLLKFDLFLNHLQAATSLTSHHPIVL